MVGLNGRPGAHQGSFKNKKGTKKVIRTDNSGQEIVRILAIIIVIVFCVWWLAGALSRGKI